eukprot:3871891-Rhodomonas_salina.2
MHPHTLVQPPALCQYRASRSKGVARKGNATCSLVLSSVTHSGSTVRVGQYRTAHSTRVARFSIGVARLRGNANRESESGRQDEDTGVGPRVSRRA